jgi:hypothetical protein
MRTMPNDTIDEISDGEAPDEPNDRQLGQNLLCPDCKARTFPSLSKLKSVLHRDKCGMFSSQSIANIGILIICHANA